MSNKRKAVSADAHDVEETDEQRQARLLQEELDLEDEAEQSSSEGEADRSAEPGISLKEQTGETINVDFNFFDPRPRDWHATKQFLMRYLDNSELDSSELAEIITKQASLGTFIKNGDIDSDPLGFVTAISLKQHESTKCVRQIKKYIYAHAKEHKKEILEVLNRSDTALVISERIVNLPDELSPPLLSALDKDMAWAKENELDHVRMHFNFKNVVLISRCFQKSKEESTSSSNDGQVVAKRRKTAQTDDKFEYYRFEEELFEKESSISFSFGVPAHTSEAAQALNKPTECRKVFVIPVQKLDGIVKKCKKK
eukprot:716849_1